MRALLATNSGATDSTRCCCVPKGTPGMSWTSTVWLATPFGSVVKYRTRSATLFFAYFHSSCAKGNQPAGLSKVRGRRKLGARVSRLSWAHLQLPGET